MIIHKLFPNKLFFDILLLYDTKALSKGKGELYGLNKRESKCGIVQKSPEKAYRRERT